MHDLRYRQGNFLYCKPQQKQLLPLALETVLVQLKLCRKQHPKMLHHKDLDYAETLFLTKGHPLYSNRSNVMLTILEDDVGRHDFTLTPCSKDTFRIMYGDDDPHHGCFGNFEQALAPYGITADDIPTAFNVFMHVAFNSVTGAISVLPPLSKPGDQLILRAEMYLIVALTACSAGQSNNFNYKPIQYCISD